MGFSSSSNGNLTLTERWNGGAWSVVSSPDTDSFENHLNAVDGVSANDLWAVGHTRNGEYAVAEPLALHWDGSAWRIVPTPTANDATLEGAVALASDDAWAVGSMFSVAQLWHVPYALHWDGRSWTRVDVPGPDPPGRPAVRRGRALADEGVCRRPGPGRPLAGAALERQRLDP